MATPKNSLLTSKKKKKVAVRAKKSGVLALDSSRGLRHFTRAFHTEVETKVCSPIIKSYVKKKFDKETARAILANPDYNFSYNHIAAYCYYDGLSDVEAIPEENHVWMAKRFADLAESGRPLVKEVEVKQKVDVYKPTIQDRMNEQLSEIIGDLEVLVDMQPSSDIPKMFEYLKTNTVAQAHIGKIRSYYEPIAAEYALLQSMPTATQLKKMSEEEQDTWEQIKEGYDNLSKKDVAMFVKFFDTMFSDLDAYANVKKAARAVRKPKPKSADKIVSKLKFKTDDDRYKIVSIDPTTIVGATELWVFNTKNRKLGKYVAEEHTQFTVKGTTLLFFDEKLSIQKTLRKPEAQLKEFGKAGKIALRTYMSDIKATETKMNGRLNEHTVLLKVSK